MLLKVCELFYTEDIEKYEGLHQLKDVDVGKRWHLFENVSHVVYDSFFREVESKDAFQNLCSRPKYEHVHKILSGPPKDIADIFPLQCCFVEFTNEQGKRELVVFNTGAYLCDALGNTISSFPNQMLQYKEKPPNVAISATGWMNRKQARAHQK